MRLVRRAGCLLLLLLLSPVPPVLPQSPPAQLTRRDKLVRAIYQRILRRTAPPLPAELANWHTHANDRAVATAVVRSTEAQAILYREACPLYFGRPRPEGEAAWLAGAVGRTAVRTDLRRHLVSLDGFWKSCGASRRSAIERLHRIQLGRAPAAAELTGWELAWERGLTLARLSDLLASSPEGRIARAQALHREVFGVAATPKAEDWMASQLAIGPEEDVLVTVLTIEPFVGRALSAP